MRLQSWPEVRRKIRVQDPVYNLREIAEKFGMTLRQIQGHMARSKIVLPRKVLSPSKKCDYYELEDFKTWWEAYSRTQLKDRGVNGGEV